MGEIKIARVREKVKNEIARILQSEISDPRAGFVTITRVELSPDFHDAKVFYSALGEPAEQRKVKRFLDDARGYIQKLVAGRLRTRVTPVLRFVFDATIEKSIRVSSILEEIKQEREARGLERSEDLADSGVVGDEPEAETKKKPAKAKPAKAGPEDDDDEDDDDDDDDEGFGGGDVDEDDEDDD